MLNPDNFSIDSDNGMDNNIDENSHSDVYNDSVDDNMSDGDDLHFDTASNVTSNDLPSYSSDTNYDESGNSSELLDDSFELSDSESYASDANESLSDDGTNDFGPENNEIPVNEDPPLFPGCPLTFSESLLSILSLTLRHTITGVLLASILQLVHLHCPEPNHCVESIYMFKKYFEHLKSPVSKHFYCSNCLQNLNEKTDQCPNCENSKQNYFMTISIISQLRALYERRGFREKLNYRYNRVKLNPQNIEDIYDGKIYQELSADGKILSDPNNISFSWYTDGVTVFKSSKFSFWPIYLVINELPYSERFKKENLILAGIWFDDKKPDANLFLLPLYNEVQELKNGVVFEIDDQNLPVNVKGIIICGTCDLPAKALFLNMIQYNGKFGCHKCKQEGARIGKIQIYPYLKNLSLRTESETASQADRVNKGPICGVKGPTVLALLVYKWITTTALDAMHCVFEGVMRMLLKLWFDP
ncbi:uncharacterized protein LOC127279252, partial [Leptopilina boulardi]|uniref:uncharacterized protein LOC127279252 n=1 Tax=Leptopilina boulardi TaxID=63433 RepID=UPI0021F52A24